MARKAKSAPVQESEPAWMMTQRKRLVEEFAQLDAQVRLFKPQLLRYEKLRTWILDWYPHLEPEQETTVPGLTNDILISARDRIRYVTAEGKKKLFQLWGPKQYIEKSIVHVKVLPDPTDEKAEYTVQSLSGPRHLHVVPRVAAPNPPAESMA